MHHHVCPADPPPWGKPLLHALLKDSPLHKFDPRANDNAQVLPVEELPQNK